MGSYSDSIIFDNFMAEALNKIFENGGVPSNAERAFAMCMRRVVSAPFRCLDFYCEGCEGNCDEYVADKTIEAMAREGTHTVSEIVQATRDSIEFDSIGYKNYQVPVNAQNRFEYWIGEGAIHVGQNGIVSLGSGKPVQKPVVVISESPKSNRIEADANAEADLKIVSVIYSLVGKKPLPLKDLNKAILLEWEATGMGRSFSHTSSGEVVESPGYDITEEDITNAVRFLLCCCLGYTDDAEPTLTICPGGIM